MKYITTFSRFISKTDLILLQITNIFSELMSNGNKEKNEILNEFIYANLKHLRNNTLPKEYEGILSKTNEVIIYYYFNSSRIIFRLKNRKLIKFKIM